MTSGVKEMDQGNRSNTAAPDSPEKFVARLRAIGAAAYHDKHPFHVLMHQGNLTRRQLQAWIENRFYYQWTIPKKDALILAKADDPEFRRAWITRITDHDGIGDSAGGISKWCKLSEAAGLDPADVVSLRYVLPGVRFAVDAYLHLCASRPLVEAVASSLTELFAPVLMADRITVLEKLYPWLDSRGLEVLSRTAGAGASRLGIRPAIRRCQLHLTRVAGSRCRCSHV